MAKECLECGESIKGRVDKKFCTDMCRNAYNNKQNSDSNNYMRTVNHILRKNRKILQDLVQKGHGKANVHRDKLAEAGFNFTHFTHIYKTKKGSIYHLCYEYGFLQLDRDFYFLVKWDASTGSAGTPDKKRVEQ